MGLLSFRARLSHPRTAHALLSKNASGREWSAGGRRERCLAVDASWVSWRVQRILASRIQTLARRDVSEEYGEVEYRQYDAAIAAVVGALGEIGGSLAVRDAGGKLLPIQNALINELVNRALAHADGVSEAAILELSRWCAKSYESSLLLVHSWLIDPFLHAFAWTPDAAARVKQLPGAIQDQYSNYGFAFD